MLQVCDQWEFDLYFKVGKHRCVHGQDARSVARQPANRRILLSRFPFLHRTETNTDRVQHADVKKGSEACSVPPAVTPSQSVWADRKWLKAWLCWGRSESFQIRRVYQPVLIIRVSGDVNVSASRVELQATVFSLYLLNHHGNRCRTPHLVRSCFASVFGVVMTLWLPLYWSCLNVHLMIWLWSAAGNTINTFPPLWLVTRLKTLLLYIF